MHVCGLSFPKPIGGLNTKALHVHGATKFEELSGLEGASLVAQVVKNPTANAGDTKDTGSVPKWGQSPGVGNGNPLQYSYPENSMDRGTWQATVHRVTKSRTQLNTHTHTHTHTGLQESSGNFRHLGGASTPIRIPALPSCSFCARNLL